MHNPATGNNTQDSWITRCPECATAFRITRTHIEAAGGSVRCGSCLHIFTATNHIIGDNPFLNLEQPVPEETSGPSSVAQPESKTNFEDDIDALMKQVDRESRQDKEQPFIFSDEIKAVEPSPAEPATDTASPSIEDQDEAWAREMLRELESEDNELLWQQPQEAEEQPLTAADNNFPDIENPANELLNPSPTSGLKTLNDEPLTLHYQEKSRLKKALWPTLNILALLALGAQLIWMNFDNLALNPSTRPLLESLCSVTTCNIHELRDVKAIKTSHIVVRDDDEFENTLVVDAIITNHAAFAQPYPRALLSITDSNQILIGQRILSPAEYLSGEAAGARMMSSNQPVHLSLQLISPGSDVNAVSLEFLDERGF